MAIIQRDNPALRACSAAPQGGVLSAAAVRAPSIIMSASAGMHPESKFNNNVEDAISANFDFRVFTSSEFSAGGRGKISKARSSFIFTRIWRK